MSVENKLKVFREFLWKLDFPFDDVELKVSCFGYTTLTVVVSDGLTDLVFKNSDSFDYDQVFAEATWYFAQNYLVRGEL